MQKFPCVVVLGARQTGKTTLLKRLMPQAPFYDLEVQAIYDRIKNDPDFFLAQVKEPIVLDEAQRVPGLFAALRVRIDKERDRRGLFLISGSSSPELLRNVTESLAGRSALFELGGFCLEEQWGLPDSPFYAGLTAGNPQALQKLEMRTTTDQLLESCWCGGFPEPFIRRGEKGFFSLWMENYFETYIKRDVRNLFPSLDLPTYQTFIRMLASSSGDILNLSNFARALDMSQPTAKSWLRIAEGTFLWRNLPPFTRNVQKRVAKAPRGFLRDSGLANHLLRNRSVEEMSMHPRVGRIWEGFIAEELLRGFRNRLLPCEAAYYRTHNDAEIDLILDGDFGTLPVEIKWGTGTDRRKLVALQAFIQDHRLPYGLLINNAERVEWLAPQILQIPATYL